MREEIIRRLREIEENEHVKILLAVESGSRAWGFESVDSDYDVRFIYVRKTPDYLKLVQEKDVLTYPVDGLFDFHGWDLKKALLLLSGSNPSLLEWIHSPIKYLVNCDLDKLIDVSREYVDVKKLVLHYRNLALSHPLVGEHVKVKKYLYYLRGFLAADWVMKFQNVPPVLFVKLLGGLDSVVQEEIDRLLLIKKNACELDVVKRNPLIDDYVSKIDGKIQKFVSSCHSKKVDLSQLDELFMENLHE